MPSIRVDKQIFPFFDSVRNPVTAPGTSDAFGNNGFESMTLEVAGTASGYVEVCMNIVNPDGSTKTAAQCSWTKVALINLEDFSVSSTFSGSGKYDFTISGFTRVRVVLTSVTGAVTILGTAEV